MQGFNLVIVSGAIEFSQNLSGVSGMSLRNDNIYRLADLFVQLCNVAKR